MRSMRHIWLHPHKRIGKVLFCLGKAFYWSGNILIAVGALVIGSASTLTRFGMGEYLYIGELIAATLMFAGFRLAGAPAPARAPAPAPAQSS